jgi:hypothetical protein
MTQGQLLFMATVAGTTVLARGGECPVSYATPDARALQAVLAPWIDPGVWLVTDEAEGMAAQVLGSLQPRHPIFETSGYLRMVGYSTDPSSVARLLGYSVSLATRQDPVLRLELCRATMSWASSDPCYPAAEYHVAAATTRSNLAGLRIHTGRANQLAADMASARIAVLGNAKRQWGLDAQTLGEDARLLGWLRREVGVSLRGLSRKRVERHDAARENPAVAEVLLLRDQLHAITAVQREASVAARAPAGRVHQFQRYAGAHTGRLTCRPECGIDVHGLRRGSDQLGIRGLDRLRSVILPEEGQNFVACDLSTIEPRVLAWLANETEMLSWLRENRDVYSAFMGLVCPGVPISKDANPGLRDLGKRCVLGLGYLIGLEAFEDKVICELGNVERDLIRRAYATYTTRFPRIRSLGGDLLSAFRHACAGAALSAGKLRLSPQQEAGGRRSVRVDLPTGRPIYYRAIELEGGEHWYARWLWLGDGQDPRPRGETERRFADGQWRSPVRASVLVENVTQAIARDLLVHMTLELERLGLQTAFSRHDEAIVRASACSCTSFDRSHNAACPWLIATRIVEDVMSKVPPSLPHLSEVPLAAQVNHAVRTSYA